MLKCIFSKHWLIPIFIIASLAAYFTYQVGMARFFWRDDFGVIPRYQQMAWWRPFISSYYQGSGLRPLGSCAVWIMSNLFGYTLWPWKTIMAGLHAFNVILLALVISRYQSKLLALLVAGIWAFLPQHIDARTWAADLPCLVGALFALLAIFYWHSKPAKGLCFALAAILSKELFAPIGLAFLALDYLRASRPRWRFILPVLFAGVCLLAFDGYQSRHGWLTTALESPNGGGLVQTSLRYWVLMTENRNAWGKTLAPMTVLAKPLSGLFVFLAIAILANRISRALLIMTAAFWSTALIYFAPRYTYLASAMLLWLLAFALLTIYKALIYTPPPPLIEESDKEYSERILTSAW